MSQFWLFIQEGFYHIVSLDSLDHLLFLLALVAIYTIKDWKKLLIMATAFTLAHAIALVFSIFNLITIANETIEWLIALTIFYTCIENLFLPNFQSAKIYIVGVFGFIHGIGFSQVLRTLFTQINYNPWQTLLPFNFGVELGQLLVLGLFLLIITFTTKIEFFTTKLRNQLISISVGIMAFYLLIQRNIFF
jgi:hypothetical protein